MAAAAGADFVDLNCGCPIHEVTRRGMGARLLRSPTKLARLVSGIAEEIAPFPLTVKIRTGMDEGKINCLQVAQEMEAAGAAAVTLHGRTMKVKRKL